MRNLLADLDEALREGMTLALAGDVPGTRAAVSRANNLLAIVKFYEVGPNA